MVDAGGIEPPSVNSPHKSLRTYPV